MCGVKLVGGIVGEEVRRRAKGRVESLPQW